MDLHSQILYEAGVKILKMISWENFEKTQFQNFKKEKNRSKNKNFEIKIIILKICITICIW